MKRLWVILLSVGLSGGCTAEQQASHSLEIGRELRAWVAGLEPKGAPRLGQPSRILRWRDSVVVLDLTAKQVVLLNRELTGGRVFGREGEGPGELSVPYSGKARQDELWIYDIGNGRVSRFFPDGSLAGDIPLPRAIRGGTFVPLSDTSLIIPEPTGQYYLSMYTDKGTVRSLISRVGTYSSDLQGELEGQRIRSPIFVVGGADDYVIVDPDQAVLLRNGGTEIIRLPADIETELQARVDSAMDLYRGGGRVAASAITSARMEEGDILLWLFGEEDLAALILSQEGTWKRLVGLSSLGAAVVRDALLWDNELFLLTEDGVRVFSLIPQ